MLARNVRFGYLATLGALVAATAAAFGPSYARLLPLAGSDSPESVLLLVPLAALVLLARELRTARRDGEEFAVNLTFAIPALLVVVLLVTILPARLSYAYWLYRLDLLAVPFFVAVGVVLVFGVPAAWRARWALLLLVCGWPPVVDAIIRATAPPLAEVQARAVGWVLAPAGVRIEGNVLQVEDGALAIGTACAGLTSVFATLLVGGVTAYVVRGARIRRLGWLATALALSLASNSLRLLVVVAVAATAGAGAAIGTLHEVAGIAIFLPTFVLELLLLKRFGLRLPALGRWTGGTAVTLRQRGVVGVAVTLAGLAALGSWQLAVAGAATPGLYRGVPELESRLLDVPNGWSVDSIDKLPFVAAMFGGGARAATYHLTGPQGEDVAAQVVVTSSYRRAQKYDAVACLAFHQYELDSTRYDALGDGGTAALVALRVGGRRVATVSWIQPVLLDGSRRWRRVVLYRYADAAQPAARRSDGTRRAVGLWLLNRIAAYGGTKTPAAYLAAENSLRTLAAAVARPRA